jgi:hypothetical protein
MQMHLACIYISLLIRLSKLMRFPFLAIELELELELVAAC